MKKLLILLLLFPILGYSNDNDDCKKISWQIQLLNKKFGKTKLSTIQEKIDSFQILIPDNCKEAQLYLLTTKGRLNKSNNNLELAEQQFNEALNYAQELKLAKPQKDILGLLAILNVGIGKYDNAISMFEKAGSVQCHTDSLQCLAASVKTIVNKGVLLNKMDRNEEALSALIFADSLVDEYNLPDSLYKLSIYNTMGNILDEALDNQKGALEAHLTALRYCPYNHRARLLLQNNIGNSYKTLEKLDSAKYYYSLTIEKTTNPKYLIVPHQGLGELYLNEPSYDEAILNFQKAIEYAVSAKDQPKLNDTRILLGRAYYLTGKYKLAKEILSKVLPQKNESYITIDEKVNLEKYAILSELALSDKDLESELSSLFSDFDTLHNINRERELKNLVFEYKNRILADSLNTLKITAINQELNLQSQRQKLYSFIALSLLAATIALLLFWQSRIRKKANTQLQQKNQEILHRTKNNLTMLSVFMKQEARRLENEEAKAAVMEAENRLQTIAMIDQKLNQQNNQAININEYLSELTDNLKNTYTKNGENVQLNVGIEDMNLDAEHAAWIGLIVNELMTNSFKYAFAEKDNPQIEIALRKKANNQIDMTYRDNGIGLPSEVNIKNAKSFGQRLIRNLTEQMDGTIQTQNDNGLVYQFLFQTPKLIS